MEKEVINKIKLGVLVTVGISMLVAAIFLIGAKEFIFTSTIKLTANFHDINGLKKGDNVRYSGMLIGVVDEVTFVNDTTIRVDFKIESGMKKFIRKDAVAFITTEGLVGNKILSLRPGTPLSGFVANNDVLPSKDPLDAPEAMDDLIASNKNLTVVSEQLSEIFLKLNAENGLFTKLSGDTLMVEQLKQTITKLNEDLDAVQHSILLRGYFNKKKAEKQNSK